MPQRYVEDRVTLRPVGGDLNICLCNTVLAPPKAFRRYDNLDVESSSVCAVLNASFSSRELHRKGFLLPAVNMPAKGVSTRLNPVRLQTIPHLRIRRPNQHEQNPCVTVMSSMLSMLDHPLDCCE